MCASSLPTSSFSSSYPRLRTRFVYVLEENSLQLKHPINDCFRFSFSHEGWLCFGCSTPTLLLPCCLLLHAARGSAALPHGGSGFPHHTPPTLPVCCGIWCSSRHCHHLSHRLPLWIWHHTTVSVFVFVRHRKNIYSSHSQMDINMKITK